MRSKGKIKAKDLKWDKAGKKSWKARAKEDLTIAMEGTEERTVLIQPE